MALRIHVNMEIGAPDATVLARAASEDMTWNPDPENLIRDATLAGNTIEEMAAELTEKIKKRILAWAAIQMQQAEDQKEQIRRQLGGDEP